MPVDTNGDKKHFCVKDARYKDEQDRIFKKIQKKIKYDDDTDSFFVDNVDKEYILDEIFEDIKKYFHYSVWGRIDMGRENSHISIVKKIFMCKGFVLILKNVFFQDDNGEKIKRKKYFVVNN